MFEEDLDSYWKTVINTMRDGILVADTSGMIVSVNRAFEMITGYSRQEIIGQKCSILNCSIYGMAREKAAPFWCKLFKAGSLNVSKCTIMRKNGTYVHVLKNASLLRDGKGNVIGAVETITDITEVVEKVKQIEAFRREAPIRGQFSWNRGQFGGYEAGIRTDRKCRAFGRSGDHSG